MKRVVRDILPLDLSDKEVVRNLHDLFLEASRVEADLIGRNDLPALRETRKSIAKSGETFFGIYRRDEIVAAISVKVICKTLEICRLIVKPEFFRKYMAEDLLRYVLDQFRNLPQVVVAMTSQNVPARRLFAKFDFEFLREEETDVNLRIAIYHRRQSEKGLTL